MANIANKVTPLILIHGGAYVASRLLGKERINNRGAHSFQSALTARHQPPHPPCYVSPLSSRVYSRDWETENTHQGKKFF